MFGRYHEQHDHVPRKATKAGLEESRTEARELLATIDLTTRPEKYQR